MRKLGIIPEINNLEQSIELTKQYNAVFEYNDFFNPNVLDDENKVQEIIKKYKDLDRDRSFDTMHGAFYDINIASSDKKIQAVSELRVEQSMEIAESLGVYGVVFHTNYIANFKLEKYVSSWIDMNELYWKDLIKRYPRQKIYIENMFDVEPYILARLAERFKGIDNFGVCFDYAHAIISGTAISEWVKVLFPYTKHMHLNDNDLNSDLHNAIGKGKIFWQYFVDSINEYKITPSVLVEVRGIEGQKTSLEYMKNNMMYPLEKF